MQIKLPGFNLIMKSFKADVKVSLFLLSGHFELIGINPYSDILSDYLK